MSRWSDTRATDIFYSVAEVRATDRAAIEGVGIAGYTLMTRAARAALVFALDRYPRARRWLFLCGGGNNAGDGFVMARLAAERGIDVRVVTLLDPAGLGGDAAMAFADFCAAGLDCDRWSGTIDASAELVVDAMLGSGLMRDVEGAFREAVDAANAHRAPVLALDIPTGLHGDSGRVMGAAVRADSTITFVGLKAGLVLGEGRAHCGRLMLADLGIPEDCRAGLEGVLRRLPEDAIRRALPPRPQDAHKGTFGHVLVVGGGPGMPGAVRLAGEAALRAGAGLVSVATHPSHHTQVLAGRPELMVHAVRSPDDMAGLLERATVIAVGPGLGQGDWSRAMLDAAVAANRPLVIDADALNMLAGQGLGRPDSVLTPHPGEAARLLGETTRNIQSDRLSALRRLSEEYGATIVLKGAGSLVSSAEGLPWVCSEGNPGMASAGMGDALSGIIAALGAQGFDAEEAAVLGVLLHARAGDAAAASGERGMLASDLIGEIRGLVNP
jgi:NAD(P)H-hydrate epimerase